MKTRSAFPLLVIFCALAVTGCVRNSSTVGTVGSNPDLGPAADVGTAQGGADGSMTDGGVTADAEMPRADAVMATPDAGSPEEDCDGLCERLAECAEQLCPDASPLVLRASCRLTCGNTPAFAALGSSLNECAELVEFVGRRNPEIAMRCPVGGRTDPLCDPYSVRAAECFTEACPNGAEIGPGIERMFHNICRDEIAAGRWADNFFQGIEGAMCDHPLIGPLVQFLMVRGDHPESGGLAGLCTQGPKIDGETCGEACGRLGGCIPPDTPAEEGGWLREMGDCRFVCGIQDVIDEAIWRCAAEQTECRAAFACFDNPGNQAPEPVPECEPYGQFVAECVVAECARAEVVSGGVSVISRGGCDKAVADNEINPAGVAALTESGDCQAPMIRQYVDYFLERTVDGTGALEGLCRGMPTNDPEQCSMACGRLSPCIEEDAGPDAAPLRDPAICEFVCVTNDGIASEAWECIAQQQMCDDVFRCFGP